MKNALLTVLSMTAIAPLHSLSAYEPPAPVFPGEQWETASPAEAGVNQEKLEEALRYFEGESGEQGISEVVVVRHGRVIWRGDRADQVHHVWSCTKSFGGIVTGLLYDDGLVTPETKIADVVPAYRSAYPDVKVHHMLSLTSGTSSQDWENMEEVRGPLYLPGDFFHYSPGLNMLSRVLTRIADEDLNRLFTRRIAEPIGIRNHRWGSVAAENERPIRGFRGQVGRGMEISAEEMARLGWLLLHQGEWDGTQLLSREWIEMSTRPHAGVETPLWDEDQWYTAIHGAYGYLFWVNGVRPDGGRLWPAAPESTFAIQGNRNNICWILPEWDMVVVRLGTDKVVSGKVNSRFLELISESLEDGNVTQTMDETQATGREIEMIGRFSENLPEILPVRAPESVGEEALPAEMPVPPPTDIAGPAEIVGTSRETDSGGVDRIRALVPSADILDAGFEAPLMRFNRHLKGGAHTWESHESGWQVPMTVAAMAGNRKAESRWREQIRYSLQPDNCLTTSGGYPAQHELILSGSYALTRQSPQLWNEKLTADERHKITLLMKAALVASAYTTADASYAQGVKPTTLDGGTNFSRGWNPNFREGMFGQLIAATVFFGGTDAVNEILNTYSHHAFVRELRQADLGNTLETFTFSELHPRSGAPDGRLIESRIRNYRFQGQGLMEPMELYANLTRHTYGRTVNCGLNDGKGIRKGGGAYGVIVSGCNKLPNRGRPGMLLELDGRDGSGPRSSITYAYTGFRPNQVNLALVILGGYWQEGALADELFSLLDVGVTDLHYKLTHGYRSYHNGKAIQEPTTLNTPKWNVSFRANLPYWENHLKPYLTKK